MRSSKIIKPDSTSQVAFEHHPKKFPVVVPKMAETFIRIDGSTANSSFKMNDLISARIGIADAEGKNLEEKVDRLVIDKLKDVEEKAYKEAYELGLEEGTKQAFAAVTQDLTTKIEGLDSLIDKIATLKQDLAAFNETHIVKVVGYLAGQVALREIEAHPESILPILMGVVGESQRDERVTIRVSPADFQFISSSRELLEKRLDNFSNLKFEEDEAVSRGGCVIENNYGTVDATIEQRIQKMVQVFSDKAPKVKDRVS